jgi:hypothetical protein
MLTALSFTRAGLTYTYMKIIMRLDHYLKSLLLLTLGSWVRPEMSHSLTSAGASTDVSLAASTNGSLIKFTTNSLVARMLSRVFLGCPGKSLNETLMIGGL